VFLLIANGTGRDGIAASQGRLQFQLLLGRELVTDVSALIALACFAIACYVMVRCFDVPVVPSAIAAKLCIVLLAPSVLVLGLSIVFCLTPGGAVAYALYMMAASPAAPRFFAG